MCSDKVDDHLLKFVKVSRNVKNKKILIELFVLEPQNDEAADILMIRQESIEFDID